MKIILFLSFLNLYFIYDGYLRCLKILEIMLNPRFENKDEFYKMPKVSVLVTVFNEAKQIEERISNILATDYPKKNIEVLIASDSSFDGTDDIVQKYKDPRVRLFRSKKSSGKTDTQNKAIQNCRGDIIIFSDANTRFDKMFVKNIVAPFSDPNVGGVDGHLLLNIEKRSYVSQSQGKYWNYEIRLREAESLLGILAVASGACMAIRRNLFRPIEIEYGEDCIVPLDIVQQGYKMFHASNAFAYDTMEHDSKKELKTRARMTIRTIQGTFSRKSLLNPFLHPGYAFALWSHKLLRWLSPVFLICLSLCFFKLAGDSFLYMLFSVILVGFYAAGVLGWLAELKRWQVPVVKTIYSFFLANIGFLFGLIYALLGHRITSYRHN